jgi:integrase
MNKVSFQLKDPAASDQTPILMLYSCLDGRLKYYTGQTIHPDSWHLKGQTTSVKGIRAKLSKIAEYVYQFADDCKVKDLPLTRHLLKSHLDSLLKPHKIKRPGELFSEMDATIDRMELGSTLTPSKKKYSKGSIKAFRFTVNLLRSFDPEMKMSAITLDTYHRFIKWCQDREYSSNYIGSQIKNWKTIGKAVGGSTVFSHADFKKITESTFDIYLSEQELKKIYELQLSDRESLVRDWFILDCYTGLRVSDLVLLNQDNYSKGFITIANEKTDETVVIPAHKYVKAIMKKHSGFPNKITDVEINRIIKRVASKAGINDRILFTITKGGKRKDEYMEKWQMVSCHTARRSFITNLRKNGVPDSIVMKLTGIRSVSTLLRYDKMSSEEAARVAAGLKFFK